MKMIALAAITDGDTALELVRSEGGFAGAPGSVVKVERVDSVFIGQPQLPPGLHLKVRDTIGTTLFHFDSSEEAVAILGRLLKAAERHLENERG